MYERTHNLNLIWKQYVRLALTLAKQPYHIRDNQRAMCVWLKIFFTVIGSVFVFLRRVFNYCMIDNNALCPFTIDLILFVCTRLTF